MNVAGWLATQGRAAFADAAHMRYKVMLKAIERCSWHVQVGEAGQCKLPADDAHRQPHPFRCSRPSTHCLAFRERVVCGHSDIELYVGHLESEL